jgi:hypothetical protein
MGAPHSLVASPLIDALVAEARGCPPGAFAEFGVYKGGVAWHLAAAAREQARALWLFDTFEGIPFSDPIDYHKPGDFSDTSLHAVRSAIPDAIFVPGVFPESAADVDLPAFAFVHVDADQYRSILAACDRFGPLMVPGGAMWFDDYSKLDGATRAVDEVFGSRVKRVVDGRAMVRF